MNPGEGSSGHETLSKQQFREAAENLRNNHTLDVAELVTQTVLLAARFADQDVSKRSGFHAAHQEIVTTLLQDPSFGDPSAHADSWAHRYSSTEPIAKLIDRVAGQDVIKSGYWEISFGGWAFEPVQEQNERYHHTMRFLDALKQAKLDAGWRAIFALRLHQAGVKGYLHDRQYPLLDLVPGENFPIRSLKTWKQQQTWWKEQIYGAETHRPIPAVLGLSDIVAYYRHISDAGGILLEQKVGSQNVATFKPLVNSIVYLRTSKIGPHERHADYFQTVLSAFPRGEGAIREAYHTIARTNPKVLTDYGYYELGIDKASIIEQHEADLAEAEEQRRAAEEERIAFEAFRKESEQLGTQLEQVKALARQLTGSILKDNNPEAGDWGYRVVLPVVYRGIDKFFFATWILTPGDGDTWQPVGKKVGASLASAFYRDYMTDKYTIIGQVPDDLITELGFAQELQTLRTEGEVVVRRGRP